MPDVRAFQDSVKKGDLDAVRGALSANPSLLNATNEAGQGAFLLAKYYRQDAVAEYLLNQGAQLNFFDECVAGATASVIAQIKATPALLDSYSTDGWTPLHLAAFFGAGELAEALLAYGAEIDARSTNSMQNTPLHAAIAGRRAALAQLLLAHGANVNARQTGGWTALHGAAQGGDRQIVEMLIAHGADIQARAENNQCALDMALMRGNQEIADLLEGLGAKI